MESEMGGARSYNHFLTLTIAGGCTMHSLHDSYYIVFAQSARNIQIIIYHVPLPVSVDLGSPVTAPVMAMPTVPLTPAEPVGRV